MPEANLFLLFSRLNTLGVAYMVSGSVAVIIYGEPRLTHDVDLIVVLGREHIARLPEVFPPAEFYSPSADVIAIEMACERRGHFSIIHHPPRPSKAPNLNNRLPRGPRPPQGAPRRTQTTSAFSSRRNQINVVRLYSAPARSSARKLN